MKKERVQIFIDGGNFYHLALKKIGTNEVGFSFEDFASFLANNREIVNLGRRYYIGTVREQEGDPRSKKAMSKQTKLFTILKSTGWEIKTSKLRFRTERIRIDNRVINYQELQKKGIKEVVIRTKREKGIDVKLATDLIVGAVDDKYDVAIIVSSDSDLVPAIDWVRARKNKKVEYIGFSMIDNKNKKENSKPLQTMIARTDVQRILVESDLRKFIK
ncbi:NYN domain protein [bacterium BMS3Abin15]|nr:NYN domain protein [bacterium BMS3Abin15]HDZ85565.1 NYN domain-containing protein [Candidatus Moranbacteria bacterium]